METPSTRRNPYVGLFIDIFRRRTRNLQLSPIHGPVYKTDILGFPLTMISDLDTMAKCYRNSEVFRSAGAFPPNLSILFGDRSMFILDGSDHTAKRASVQAAFTPQLFPLYFEPMTASAREFWDEVSTGLQSGNPVTLSTVMKNHYLRLIIRITSGQSFAGGNAISEEFTRLRDLFENLNAGMFTIMLGPVWNRSIAARGELLGIYEALIRERLETQADVIENIRSYGDRLSSLSKKDLRTGTLDILTVAIACSPLPTGGRADLDEAILRELGELVLLLWFAGYSTQVATTLSCVMEIGFDSNIRQRLRAEQDEIVEASGSQEMTFAQVTKQMPLLDSFISEMLRLYPPAATILRKTSEEIVVCNHLIPAGENIGLDAWGGQRNPKYFSNPDSLKLDRFMSDSVEQASSLISFGASGGPHFCVGAALARISMKVTLSTLLRYHDVELDGLQRRDYIEIPDMRPASGVIVSNLSKRNS